MVARTFRRTTGQICSLIVVICIFYAIVSSNAPVMLQLELNVRENFSHDTVSNSYSTPPVLESVLSRQEKLSNFCNKRPWLERGQPNPYSTVFYQSTSEVFCLNPKTGSTSLKTLLHMKFTNKNDSVSENMTSGNVATLIVTKNIICIITYNIFIG